MEGREIDERKEETGEVEIGGIAGLGSKDSSSRSRTAADGEECCDEVSPTGLGLDETGTIADDEESWGLAG